MKIILKLVIYPSRKENTKYIIPNTIKLIDDYDFYENTKLKEIVIQNGVNNIGESAFVGTEIKEIVIPNSVTSIGRYAFKNCNELLQIIIPDSVNEIYYGAFYECKKLKNVYVSNNVEKIYADRWWCGIFSNCSSNLQIYTDAIERKSRWDEYWNGMNEHPVTEFYTVNYNTSLEEFNSIVASEQD